MSSNIQRFFLKDLFSKVNDAFMLCYYRLNLVLLIILNFCDKLQKAFKKEMLKETRIFKKKHEII